MPPAEEDQPPQLARYRIRRQLGKGAFGAIWLADDQELKRQVVIKMPRQNQLQRCIMVQSRSPFSILLLARTVA